MEEKIMEKFIDEINEKYAGPREAFDKAYDSYIGLLVDLQTTLAVGLENHAMLMSKDSTNTIINIISNIAESDLAKIFNNVENSPVTSSIRTAVALWDSTCYTIGYYIANEIDKKDAEDNSGTVLHVIASILAIFELLQHAVSFANFEDTIDKNEYAELYSRFQSLMESEENGTISESTEE